MLPRLTCVAHDNSSASVLLLLDGHSLAYRAFYALPVENFSTTTGAPTNAVYGFTSMLINLLRDEQPSHVAVAFDISRTSWRTSEYPEYKATRSASPEAFVGQVDLIKQVLDALAIQHLSAPDYEADDVIATLADRAVREGMTVRICTGDRDALQLVTDQVTVLYPVKGVSELMRYTPEAVQAKYGLTPTQYPDFAALRGDPSDNLPGIPGVGEKTAAKWITQYGSMTSLVDHVDQVRGKVGDALRANLDSVLLNRRLTELVRDVPVPTDPKTDLAARPFDRTAVHAIFDDLQFRVLRDRLLDVFGDQTDPETVGTVQVERIELAPGELASYLKGLVGTVGLASDAHYLLGVGNIYRLALASASGTGVVLDLDELNEADDAALAAYLADADRPKMGHAIKPLINVLAARGVQLRGIICDTELAAYLIAPGQRTFDLDDLAQRFLHRTVDAATGNMQLSLLDDGQDAAKLLNSAGAVIDLADVLLGELDTSGQRRLLDEVELPVQQVLAQMEQCGIAIDTAALEDLRDQYTSEAAAAASAAYEVLGKQVNLGSPKQLQAVLFDELGMPKTKRTRTGYTTDADALAWLFGQTEHPFLAHLLRHRDVTKLRTTVEGLLKSVSDDGRIHTTFPQTVAATGRLSSTDPNLQNIPVRTAEGRLIRRVFVVGEGYECLLTADYSQIEMRIMAHLSADQKLIEAFNSGEDLHTFVASQAFGVPITDVDSDLRRRVKAMTYGLAYGLSAYGLAGQLKISVEEAREQMEAYFARFGGVRDYLQSVVAAARVDGFTQTIFGRRRYLPDLASDNRQRRELAERVALNSPIQGSAADIIKIAMIGVQRRLEEHKLHSRLLLQVHDELVCEVASGELDTVKALLTEEMAGAYSLSVPLDVSMGVGRSWDDAAH